MPKKKTKKRKKVRKNTTRRKTTKKRKTVTMKPQDSVHICVTSPLSKRKAVLLAGIDIVELLKRFETIKDIRKEKKKTMDKLNDTMDECQKLVKAIRLKELPITKKELKDIRDSQGNKLGEQMVQAEPMKMKAPTPKAPVLHKSTIDQQLDALRQKLESL